MEVPQRVARHDGRLEINNKSKGDSKGRLEDGTKKGREGENRVKHEK